MKVAIIGTRGYPYVYGGFETFVKELGERLVKKDVEVYIYCQAHLFPEKPAKVNGIHLHYIPTLKAKSLNQIIHSFLSIIHATFSSCDVILVVNLAAGPMGWIPKITGKKTIINVDGLEWLRPKWKGLGAAYFRFAARLATKLYDLIITDADAMRDVYLKEFNQDSLVIAYGAPPFKKADPSLLNRFNIIPDEYYLIVGRLIPDNNADLIIKAYIDSSSVKKLVVVGDVPYRDKYADDLKKLAGERVHFVGYVRDNEELMSLYQNCFSYIHGHKFGGTNPAMLKAMSNNCAILALNTSFNQEMLTNGKFGLLFEENTGSIQTSMNILERDELLIKQLRSVVSSGLTDKYNWDFVTSSYHKAMIDLYNSISKK
jgi:glycosyltransferase involved in cell wall biosynthesis